MTGGQCPCAKKGGVFRKKWRAFWDDKTNLYNMTTATLPHDISRPKAAPPLPKHSSAAELEGQKEKGRKENARREEQTAALFARMGRFDISSHIDGGLNE